MKLHIFGVDDAHARAPGHADAVPARACRVGGAQEDLAQAAGRQHRLARQNALHLARRLVKDIGPHAGAFVVDRQPVARVVRRREQLHRRMARKQGDVGVAAHGVEQRDLDGLARGVRGVDDARQAVPALQRQRERPARRAVEADLYPLQQDAAQHIRPVLRHDLHGARVTAPVAGAQDILRQQRRRVILAPVDDAALRPIGVAVFRLGGARHHHDGDASVGEDQGRGRPGNAAADDEDVSLQMVRHGRRSPVMNQDVYCA